MSNEKSKLEIYKLINDNKSVIIEFRKILKNYIINNPIKDKGIETLDLEDIELDGNIIDKYLYNLDNEKRYLIAILIYAAKESIEFDNLPKEELKRKDKIEKNLILYFENTKMAEEYEAFDFYDELKLKYLNFIICELDLL